MNFKVNLEEIIRAYSSDLYRILYVYCKNKSDCEDIMQGVFLKLLETDTDFESKLHIKNWLIKVAVRDALNLYKSRWKNYCELDETITFMDEYHSEVFEEILKLKREERLAIILFYYYGYSVREISSMMRVSQGTIKSRLHRGRNKLRKVLKEGDWDEE